MANFPAEGLLTLERSKEATALIGFVTDATVEGDFAYGTIAELAAMQQRQAPESLSIQRVLLVQYTGVNTANRAERSSGNNINANDLDIREGATRHSFDDDYFAIEVHFRQKYSSSSGANGDWTTIIPIEAFNAPASQTDHRSAFTNWNGRDASIYRVSDTSFAVYDFDQVPQTNNFLRAIYGLKWVVS